MLYQFRNKTCNCRGCIYILLLLCLFHARFGPPNGSMQATTYLRTKKTFRRGEENPIRVFHASRLLHACEQVSYKPFLNPVSSLNLPLDPLLPKVILPQD